MKQLTRSRHLIAVYIKLLLYIINSIKQFLRVCYRFIYIHVHFRKKINNNILIFPFKKSQLIINFGCNMSSHHQKYAQNRFIQTAKILTIITDA